ncbi:MAG: glycosyltransferase family 2 protein [Desulfobulbaceae bacterium]|nr:glycosyltransferase family 2 protein [Desulfobulbaceae bacterium]
MTRVSVVIPVNNEQNNILPLIGQIHRELSQTDGFEVVCIEDYSSDATFPLLKEAAASLKFLRIIRLKQQCGQSAALWLGVQAARYPIIVSMDGDGQNDPADIVPMLAFFLYQQQQGNERVLVIGHRSDRHDDHVRKVSSWIGNRSQRLLLGESAPDSGCGLKIFSRDFFLTLPRFNHMHRFLPYLFRNNGGSVLSSPVRHLPASTVLHIMMP